MYFPRIGKNFNTKYTVYLISFCLGILMCKKCWLQPSIDVKFDKVTIKNQFFSGIHAIVMSPTKIQNGRLTKLEVEDC